MDRASMKEHAREQIRGKIFTLFAMYLVVGLALAVINFITGGLLNLIVTLIVSGPIAFAGAVIFLGITKKSRMPLFEDLICGFKGDNFLRNFLAYLRFEIFTFLWGLLFIIPGIIKAISYSQMFYLLAEDDKLEAGEAQRKSMEIMEGHKCEYLVLHLSFIPWHLLGIITFGIAYIWVSPYINTTLAEYYVRLTKGNKPSTNKKSAKPAIAAKTTKTSKSTKNAKTTKAASVTTKAKSGRSIKATKTSTKTSSAESKAKSTKTLAKSKAQKSSKSKK